ncbi:hypothetical protein ASE85_13600 [Sphingobium sp. Leaf26]|uniref:hypothetical protein n=1 Tax=Sphingobium sp. Leaf26 TaxID=1735693 RepID=UPI0006F761AC|nr:hypothetical protein [Sphingobium sp. Leaf26]KQM97903.1 hypothetical protein ASE85_13600 [Sphingobium sp. Leaf26]
MHFDDQLLRYFGTTNFDSLPATTIEAGIDRMCVDLGLEEDRGRRFALWSLLYLLGAAPGLDVAFTEEADREAARNFMDLTDQA